MKKEYKEVSMSKLLLGEDNYTVYDCKETEERIEVCIKTTTESDCCPECGERSSHKSGTYERSLQALPIRGISTVYKVRARSFFCDNENCSRRCFNEKLSFAQPSQHRTVELNQLILGVSLMMSNNGASKTLGLVGVKVGKDSIRRLIDRIEFRDWSEAEEIGIDDVAYRKGMSYGTVIYDAETHEMIALVDGRKAEDVKEMLSELKNVKRVSRDRAGAYAQAINEVFGEEVIQIADRFHLLQNLIDRLSEIFRDELPESILLDNNGEVVSGESEEKEGDELQEIEEKGYDDTPPLDEKGEEILFEKRNIRVDRENLIREGKSNQEKTERNRALILKARKLRDSGMSFRKIGKELGISSRSIRRYVQMTEEEVENYSFREKTGIRTPLLRYANLIYKLLDDGYGRKTVCDYILRKYDSEGSVKRGNLYNYISNIQANNFGHKKADPEKSKGKKNSPKGTHRISRRAILTYITSKNKPEGILSKGMEAIRREFPVVRLLEEVYQDFYDILMGEEHDPERLEEFLLKYQDERRIASFCRGIQKDKEAVRNAILFSDSSGFVEGNNNKLKLIKRILYGRAGRVTLEKKCKLAFMKLDRDSFRALLA